VQRKTLVSAAYSLNTANIRRHQDLRQYFARRNDVAIDLPSTLGVSCQSGYRMENALLDADGQNGATFREELAGRCSFRRRRDGAVNLGACGTLRD
jgi:hypothetical protein